MNLHATHVAYVNEGSVTLEQRGLRESDWRDDAASSFEDESDSDGESHKGSVRASATSSSCDGSRSGGSSSCDGSNNSELDPKALAELRQVAFKKRSALPKLEAKIEKTEGEVSERKERTHCYKIEKCTVGPYFFLPRFFFKSIFVHMP